MRRKEKRAVKTRRPEARARDEAKRGAPLPLPSGPAVLYDDARATAVLARRGEFPGLVEEAGRLRSLSFAGEARTTGERYGLDGYDDYYAQLLVLDKASGTIAAGTRLGLGQEVVEGRGWEGFHTAKHWVFGDGMVDVARRGVEVGRTWVHPLHRKVLRGLALLFGYVGFLAPNHGTLRRMVLGLVVLVLVTKTLMMVGFWVTFGHLVHDPIALTCYVVGVASVLASVFLPDGDDEDAW